MAFLPIYILILGFTIVVDYFAGLYIEQAEGKRRKLYLIGSLIANIGVLAVFKYYNFFNDNLSLALNDLGYQNYFPALSILLPIGLSFHTFQAMSYTIEVYRGNQKAERNFGIYALYVMFYPQLVAGPIERPQNMLHQFYEKHEFDYHRVVDGLKLMAWGMFKKVVVADRLAIVTDPVFNNPPLTLALATFFFSFQIYCDFSGYSDIAIGSARVMGFRLMKNFDRPYSSKSISEFWTRWHISLSTWFKDYLYIPLGGNRVSIPRWYFNLFFVFLVSGLWHGANWTFIIWGALHGFYLIFGIATRSLREQIKSVLGISKIKWLNNLIQILITFTLVTVAWVFFRANSVGDAMYILGNLPSAAQDLYISLLSYDVHLGALQISRTNLLFCLVLIALLEATQFLQKKYNLSVILNKKPIYIRWAFYYLITLTIIYLGVFDNRQFIYFQF
jgi:D-alanyl-lipoteichoic acid acyltransferase DltB (MBOAT superfamily)